MNGNLVAFGCSLTYGQGLVDCHVNPNSPGLFPSRFAWPAQLAKIGNRNCINLGIPGAGNWEISLAILSYNFAPDDVCFILWSHLDRDLIIHDDRSQEQLGVWKDQKKFKALNLINPEQTKLTKFWFYVISINSWLALQNVKVYNLSVNPERVRGNRPAWADDIKFLSADIYRLRHQHPKALDNSHPGTNAHRAMADEIAAEIGWLV